MTSFERVLLYIGAPKTGTTTIQNILRRNRAALLKQGFHVPRAGQSGTGQHIDLPAIVLAGDSRADLDRHIDFDRLSKGGRRRRFVRTLDEELNPGRKCHTLLLFSEHMFYSDAAEVPAYRDLMSRYANRLECLMYLRRQDRWLASLSIQIRKTDPSRRLELDPGPVEDYGRRLRAWDAASDVCHTRRFESEFLRDGDLLADFFHTVGIDATEFEVAETRANPSLLQEQMELMDALNARLDNMTPARRVHFRQGFVPLCTDAAGGARIEFPRDAAERTFDAYDGINTWLARRHDPQGPSRFFTTGFEDYPEAPRNEARYDERALLAILAEIAATARRKGFDTPTPPSAATRGALIDQILTAFIALRRAAV